MDEVNLDELLPDVCGDYLAYGGGQNLGPCIAAPGHTKRREPHSDGRGNEWTRSTES